jgi:arylsulfatase A-like enzyme
VPAPDPTPTRLMRTALALGFCAGSLEIALRAAPRLGMDSAERIAWLAVAVALSSAVTVGGSLGLLVLRRFLRRTPALGLVMATLVFLHGALFWRLELHVNAFTRDPVVWGGVLAIGVVSLLLGGLLDRPLRALAGKLDVACITVALIAAAVGLVRGQPPAPPDAAAQDAPNLLVITLDTVRHDALEPYGGPVATPAIQRLADEGTLFETAIATAPLTEASHLAMLTGLEPTTSGVVSNGTDFGQQPALISHSLQQAGWATGGFVAGFPLHGRWGWTQGFDVYDDDFGSMPGLHRLAIVKAWDQIAVPGGSLRERRGDAVIQRTTHWLDRVDGRPWFAWVHLFDPHGPYEAPPPYHMEQAPPRGGDALELPAYWPPALRSITSTAWLDEAYHAEIRYTDALLGQLFASLEARGEMDRTLVLLVADHGESLTEHGYLFDHGDNLYDPSLRVPLILRWPGSIPAGLRLDCQVSTVSVASTLIEAAGLPEGPHGRDGGSLLPLIDSRQGCQPQDAYATTVAGKLMEDPPLDHALRARDRKLIAHEAGGSELYDLLVDPGETRDLAAERSDEAAALGQVLGAHLAGGAEIKSASSDQGTQEALRALGYIE